MCSLVPSFLAQSARVEVPRSLNQVYVGQNVLGTAPTQSQLNNIHNIDILGP